MPGIFLYDSSPYSLIQVLSKPGAHWYHQTGIQQVPGILLITGVTGITTMVLYKGSCGGQNLTGPHCLQSKHFTN